MSAPNEGRERFDRKNGRVSLACAALCILAVSMTSGCAKQTPPLRYVTLSLASEFATAQSSHGAALEMWVGIGPIRLPGYLARSQLVIAQSRNVFRADEQARWAEAIEDNFSRVLLGDLALLAPEAHFITHPWAHERAPKFSVRVDVQEFHADSSGAARLAVRWEWFDGMRRVPGAASFLRHAAGRDSESIVAALSLCLADFSRRLALELGKLAIQ